MFTLKVIENYNSSKFYSNSKHENGGIDYVQVYAFRHLFPQDECPLIYRELVHELANIHNWDLEIKIIHKD